MITSTTEQTLLALVSSMQLMCVVRGTCACWWV